MVGKKSREPCCFSKVRTLIQYVHIRSHAALNAELVLNRRALARRCVPVIVDDLESDVRLVVAHGIVSNCVRRVLVLDCARDLRRTLRHSWRHRGAICACRGRCGGVLHEISPRGLACQRIGWWGGALRSRCRRGSGRESWGGASVGSDFGEHGLLRGPSSGRFEVVGVIGY